MARSNTRTQIAATSQYGRVMLLKSPHPRASARTATPTTPRGATSRTRTLFTATRPRLRNQRNGLRAVRPLRGASISPAAMATSTPKKQLKQMPGSDFKIFHMLR